MEAASFLFFFKNKKIQRTAGMALNEKDRLSHERRSFFNQ